MIWSWQAMKPVAAKAQQRNGGHRREAAGGTHGEHAHPLAARNGQKIMGVRQFRGGKTVPNRHGRNAPRRADFRAPLSL
jgi:hypothetical protein